MIKVLVIFLIMLLIFDRPMSRVHTRPEPKTLPPEPREVNLNVVKK